MPSGRLTPLRKRRNHCKNKYIQVFKCFLPPAKYEIYKDLFPTAYPRPPSCNFQTFPSCNINNQLFPITIFLPSFKFFWREICQEIVHFYKYLHLISSQSKCYLSGIRSAVFPSKLPPTGRHIYYSKGSTPVEKTCSFGI